MKSYKERTEKVMEKAEIQTKKRKKMKKLYTLAGVAAFLLAFNLTLFVPYTAGVYTFDLKPYENSEYYSVIQTISRITNRSSKGYTTNNFYEWFEPLFPKFGASAPDMSEAPPTASDGNFATAIPDSSESLNGNYQEVTDNQTAGVREGDLFKRSDKYIFYLSAVKNSAYRLDVYSIAGTQSKKISEFEIKPEQGLTFNGYSSSSEMYLSRDCSTVTVLSPAYNQKSRTLYTMIAGIDVSDVSHIREIGRSYVSGDYVTSRIVDGSLLLTSNFTVRYHADFSDEVEFLPQAGKWGELKSLPAADIVCPEGANSASYTVVSSFDEKTFEVTDSVALLSFSSDIYVSAGSLYATRNIYGETEIRRISYGGGKLEIKNDTSVKGSVLNRYCMDEYEGVLRVVTTVGETRFSQSASLYCLNAETFTQVAAVEEFAPKGEKVKSVRFYGNTAYVCTAEEFAQYITDPVFVFDLSNYQSISYKDTGTIPGYSLSLTAFKDGTLVGIGYGNDRQTLKIEVYEESESQVVSVAEYISENTVFSQNYKAYFIDKERGLVGLYVTGREDYYLLLQFDGYNLVKISETQLYGYVVNYSDIVRACCVEDTLYIISSNDFEVVTLG